MPSYNDLRPKADYDEEFYARIFPDLKPADKARIIENLLTLKVGLRDVPPRRTGENLLVASWNIKEFGHLSQRLPEAYFYIAQIMERFDLIAVQEIKRTLKDLEIVMKLLGDDWRYLITDITGGTKGNKERSGYIYNTRRVETSGLAGEITLWNDITDNQEEGEEELLQLHRTPYITGFRAGWKEFAMINLHLQPGDSKKEVALRAKEVKFLLAAVEEMDGKLWSENFIITGDMNLYHKKDDDIVAHIKDAGFFEANSLKGLATAVSGKEAYDRLFLTKTNEYFRLEQTGGDQPRDSAGVFTFMDHVYRDDQVGAYETEMKADYGGTKWDLDDPVDLAAYYDQTWRRNQMSDHMPVWIELAIDDSDRFLTKKLGELTGA